MRAQIRGPAEANARQIGCPRQVHPECSCSNSGEPSVNRQLTEAFSRSWHLGALHEKGRQSASRMMDYGATPGRAALSNTSIALPGETASSFRITAIDWSARALGAAIEYSAI